MAEAALGLAASIITVVDLFVKIGVQCSVYCADLKTAPRDVRYILKEADKFTATLKEVDRLLAGPNGAKIEASQNVCHGVADCRLQLVDLAAKLEQGTKCKRIMWPLKKKEMVDIIEKLEQWRAAISLDLQVGHTVLLRDVHQEIVLAKLRAVEGATFDSQADAGNARCHPGTRIDVLQQIQIWGAAPDGDCVFWLNGMAGTGKSTISRTVAQAFADKGMLGASFFFKRGEGDRGHAAFVFTTIAAQLVHRLPSIAPYVRAEIEADPTINGKSIKDQFDKLIADPIQKISSHSQPPVIAIVMDALDECDNPEHMRLIIHSLSQAKRFTSVRLRFFVTSRPELPVRLGFKDISGKYEDLVLHQIPKPVIERDITLFLEHELARIRQDYNKSVTSNRQLPPDWPGTECIQTLTHMAIPLFIFAATVCRLIQDRRFGGPKDQLVRILKPQESRKSNLDATYLPVLDQLLAGLDESEKREVAERFKQIVGSIVILASPLSTPTLSRLLAVSLDAIEDQLDLLHSILNIPSDPTAPVRLLHLSFRDFLVDPENQKERHKYPFWVDERETHERLAHRCLQLLLTGDILKRDVCGLRLPGTRRSEIDPQIIDTTLPPETQYACRYWIYHWKGSGRRVRDGDLVDHFLTLHLLHWLEVLGLLGRISESISMVDDLLGLLDPEESSNVSAFLRDTRRVILNHCSIIDISPLQVYYSAIVFAPERSIVRKTYQDQFPTWLSQLPRVDRDWNACLQTLEGHIDWVNSVTFSRDSTLLASASDDCTIKLWDVVTGTCTTTFKGHSRWVNSVIFSHDSRYLVSASGDHTVKLWDIATGVNTATLNHSSSVYSVALSRDSILLVSALDDHTIKIWEIATWACTATLEGHSSRVRCITFSFDSRHLASASDDHTIGLWDVATGICITMLDGHSRSVFSIAFSHDSRLLASGSGDRTIKLWDLAIGIYTATLEHSSSVYSVAFSHNSTLLASASDDHTIKLWDVATGVCTATHEHSRSVCSVTFSHDSRLLASASQDRTIKLWDVVAGASVAVLEGHSSFVNSVVFSHNFMLLASVSDDNTIKLWDVATGTCMATFEWHNSSIYSVTFSHNSMLLASVLCDGTIKLCDVTTGACTVTLEGHSSSVYSVAFSHSSKLLASASSDRTVKLWDVRSGACMVTLEGHNRSVYLVVFSQDFTLLASTSDDRTVKIWDITRAVCIATFKHSSWVYLVAFSYDSRLLASASSDTTISLWDIAAAVRIATAEVRGALAYLAFDANGSSLYTDRGTFTLHTMSPPLYTTPTMQLAAGPTASALAPLISTSAAILTAGPLPSNNSRGIGLSEDGAWVVWNSHRILWLPPAYRPGQSVVAASTVAIGCISGRVVFITVSAGKLTFP